MINETEAPERIGIVSDENGTFRLWDAAIDRGRYVQTPAIPYVPEAIADAKDKRIAELTEALQQVLIEYDDAELANAEPVTLTAAILEARSVLKGETQ